jgi:hypothetical protein
MPATPSDLFTFLDRLGIAHRTVTHPALFTVEQSRTLRGTIPGGHTKNMISRQCQPSSMPTPHRASELPRFIKEWALFQEIN